MSRIFLVDNSEDVFSPFVSMLIECCGGLKRAECEQSRVSGVDCTCRKRQAFSRKVAEHFTGVCDMDRREKNERWRIR